MNYRHIFHAGNICDTVKHTVLTLLLGHLRSKDAGFFVLDTHAGIGLYDLQDPRAARTGEAQSGILKFLSAPPLPELKDYYDMLRALNPGWNPGTADGFRYYPGSPLLAYQMLRPQDRLVACELHDDGAHELRRQFHDRKQAAIHHRDGYEALRAFLPPEEKRGCVLIDPPYEQPDEFERLGIAIADAYKRWPQGIFAVWYPVKERPAIWHFHEALIATGIRKILCAEFVYEEEIRADRLNGCGFILINAPWQMDEKLLPLFDKLHAVMETGYRGSTVKWLAAE